MRGAAAAVFPQICSRAARHPILRKFLSPAAGKSDNLGHVLGHRQAGRYHVSDIKRRRAIIGQIRADTQNAGGRIKINVIFEPEPRAFITAYDCRAMRPAFDFANFEKAAPILALPMRSKALHHGVA